MAAYPRKQTLVIFGVCSVAVIGAAAYVHGGFSNAPAAPQPSVADIEPAAAATSSRIASNEDWKKQFLAAEASGGSFKAPKAKNNVPSAPEKLTATDVLARNFFTQYVQLRQYGLTDNSQSVTDVMDQVIQDSAGAIAPPKEYSLGDIHVVNGDAADAKAYIASVRSILDRYDSQPYEGNIATEALANQDMSILSKIDPIIANDKSMIAELAAMPVPSKLARYHLDLLNSFSLVLYSAEAFRNMNTDAFTGFAAIRLNAAGVQGLAAAYAAIQAFN